MINSIINDALAYPKTADFGANPGGYNVLNLPSNSAKGLDTFYKTPISSGPVITSRS